jgi:hypothetical protein
MQDEPTKHARERVLSELEVFLRSKNTEPRSRLRGLDRPISVTLLGVVLLGAATTVWQTHQDNMKMRLQFQQSLVERRLDVIREFSKLYQRDLNILNGWLIRIKWISEEKLKPVDQQSSKSVTLWADQIDQSFKEYTEAVPIDAALGEIRMLFRSDDIGIACSQFEHHWKAFEELLNEASREFGSKQALPTDRLNEIEKRRTELLQQLEGLRLRVIEAAYGSLSLRAMEREMSSWEGR